MMNTLLLPVLLSPLGSMSAQAPGIDISFLLGIVILIPLNVIGPVITSGLAGRFSAKHTGDPKAIFTSTVTGIGIGILIAVVWWMLAVEEFYESIHQWPPILVYLVVIVLPNPIGILITVLIVRKVIVRLLNNRRQDSTVD